MRKEKLTTVEVMEYKTFKEKMEITKEIKGACKVTFISNTHLYIERWTYE